METLDKMISATMSGGLFHGFFVGARIDISHLLFVDDTLLFYGANQTIFTIFEASYFLKLCRIEDELSQVGIGSYGKCR